jgi:hypothetical protein
MSNDPNAMRSQSNPYAAGGPVQEPVYNAQLAGQGGHAAYQNQGDGTGGLIPYKNPKALIAYYLGIFSFIPLLGIFLGIAAFVLGILGLRDRKRNPVIKGSIHAWIGIVVGGGFALLYSGLLILGIVTAIANA